MQPTGDVAPRKIGAKPAENPNIPPPDDFETAADFLLYARKLYADDRDFDRDNRDAAIEDAEFVAGKQWDDYVKMRREGARRPALTINRTVAFVAQVIGARRLNDTQIKILPEHGGTKEIALTRQGIIRNSENRSKSNRAYDTAMQNQIIGGLGGFGIELDYTRYDVFDQDINWVERPDAFSQTWDRLSIDKTGRDANHVFVTDTLANTEYFERYPWATTSEFMDDQAQYMEDWFTSDDVRVAAFWRMRFEPATLALMQDGKIVDVTDWYEDDPRFENVARDELTGAPYVRETSRPYAEKYIISGTDILEGPYRLNIRRVPEFRVPAWEITINGKRHRFGLVRFLKDPQRLHNYWRSTIAEKLILAPRARWLAADSAVSGRESKWREAHLSDDPLLIYNSESGTPPVYTPPPPLEVALIQEANMSAQDMRDVSNLHEAYMGQQSNEVSGKAIEGRQRQGDVGTVLYHDNMNDAIGEGGEVANDLVPVAFDNARTARLLDEDNKESFQRINDPTDPDSVDIGVGLYSVVVVAGPTTATKLVEAQEAMQNVFNAAPETFAQAADLWVGTMNFPGADKLAKRLRKLLPANLIDPEDLDPRERQQYEMALQQQQEQQKIQLEVAAAQLQAQLAEQTAKARKAEAEAKKAEADAVHAVARAESEEIRRELMRAQATASRVGAIVDIAELGLAAEDGVDDANEGVAEISAQLFTDDMLQPEEDDDNG